jgi:hypothetical protein
MLGSQHLLQVGSKLGVELLHRKLLLGLLLLLHLAIMRFVKGCRFLLVNLLMLFFIDCCFCLWTRGYSD